MTTEAFEPREGVRYAASFPVEGEGGSDKEREGKIKGELLLSAGDGLRAGSGNARPLHCPFKRFQEKANEGQVWELPDEVKGSLPSGRGENGIGALPEQDLLDSLFCD